MNFNSSTLDMRSNSSLRIKAQDALNSSYKGSARNLTFKREDRNSFTETTALGKELYDISKESTKSKINTISKYELFND